MPAEDKARERKSTIKIYRIYTSTIKTKIKEFNSYLCTNVNFNTVHLGTFPVALIKYPDKSSPKKKGRRDGRRGEERKIDQQKSWYILGHSLKAQCIMVVKSQ